MKKLPPLSVGGLDEEMHMNEVRQKPLNGLGRFLGNKTVLSVFVLVVLAAASLLVLVWAGDAREMVGANLAAFFFMGCVMALIGVIGTADGTPTANNEHK